MSNRSIAALPKKICRQDGYLLIEILVTTVILAGGILFLIDSIRSPLRVARQSLCTEQGFGLGAEIFHELMANPEKYDELNQGQRQIAGITYKWAFEEKQLVKIDPLPDEVWIVLIKISWHDKKEFVMELPFLWSDKLKS